MEKKQNKLLRALRLTAYKLGVPALCGWFFMCVGIMKIGKGIYMFGDMLSGWNLNHKDWNEDI